MTFSSRGIKLQVNSTRSAWITAELLYIADGNVANVWIAKPWTALPGKGGTSGNIKLVVALL